MRHIKGVGIGLISFVILFLLIGLILPDRQIVHRDLWLKTGEAKVESSFESATSWIRFFPQLSELDSSEVDIEGKLVLVYPENGKIFEFKQDSLNDGFASILQQQKDIEGIKVEYQFSWTEPDSGTVRMNIDTQYSLGSNPFYRFIGIGFNDIMDKDLQALMSQMKLILEENE